MNEIDQEFTLPRSAAETLLEEGEVTVQRKGGESPLQPKTYRFTLEDES